MNYYKVNTHEILPKSRNRTLLSNSNTVHGILQARILEWIAFSFSRGYSQPRDRTQVSFIASRFSVFLDFPCGSAGKEFTCNEGDLGEGNSYSFQYSGLENSMDCIVHGVKGQTRLREFHFQAPPVSHPSYNISIPPNVAVILTFTVIASLHFKIVYYPSVHPRP